VDYARQYVSMVPLAAAPGTFWVGATKALSTGGLIWLLGLAGLGLVGFDPRWRGGRWALVALNLAGFLTVCPGFLFRMHYFLLMLPGLALSVGVAVSAGCRFARPAGGAARLPAWPLWVYAAVVLFTTVENQNIWFRRTPVEVARLIYPGNPFPEAEVIAQFIRTHSPAGTRIAILGSEPEICFLSRRHSATGYIYTYPLMESQPFAGRMQEEMIREIEAARPEIVVLAIVGSSWLPRPDSPHTLTDWWAQTYQTNYDLAGLVDLGAPGTTRYSWGREAQGRGLSATGGLLIYSRQTGPAGDAAADGTAGGAR